MKGEGLVRRENGRGKGMRNEGICRRDEQRGRREGGGRDKGHGIRDEGWGVRGGVCWKREEMKSGRGGVRK